ncbi:hypothetical protein EDC04DRAFT_1355581 [Pisolithus marmoratus]|nr:hypothetical protein EDC04DRAFT_1355581 [Pisolithus marmoratus]
MLSIHVRGQSAWVCGCRRSFVASCLIEVATAPTTRRSARTRRSPLEWQVAYQHDYVMVLPSVKVFYQPPFRVYTPWIYAIASVRPSPGDSLVHGIDYFRCQSRTIVVLVHATSIEPRTIPTSLPEPPKGVCGGSDWLLFIIALLRSHSASMPTNETIWRVLLLQLCTSCSVGISAGITVVFWDLNT